MDFNMSVRLSPIPAEEPALYVGRVSKTAFEVSISIFYGLAMIVATIRLVLQMKFHRRLNLDDYLLILACAFLTAATVLGYTNVGDLYFTQRLNYNPGLFFYYLSQRVDVIARINTYQRLYYTYPALLWATIFIIKAAYLAFFRRLIEHIRPLIIFWRVIVGITIVSFPICILSIYVACTKQGVEVATCLQSVYFHRALGLAILNIVLDLGTDLLIIGIPIHLLWTVKIRPRQKFVLGIFLSLNLVMAITASIRVSGLKFRGTFDVVWLFLWQQIEACVAVTMLSLTAFRSAFVASASARVQRESPNTPWYSSTVEAIKRNRALRRHDEESSQGLPQIPSATLTGLRTFIRGEQDTTTSSLSNDRTPIYEMGAEKGPFHKDKYKSNHEKNPLQGH